MKHQLLLSTLSLIVSVAFSACGNDAGNDRERDRETFVRIFNGVTDIPGVDVAVDDELYFSDVGYLESSGYFRIRTTGKQLQVTVTNSFTPIYQRDGAFDDESDNSLFVYGDADEERALLTKDENQSPGEDFSKVRVVNLSKANRRSLDVYIVSSDSTTLPSAPAAEGLGTGAASRYVTSSNGQYDIVVTSTNATERLVSLSRQTFDSKGVYTVVVADSVGGELPLRVVLLKDSK
jgi:hypothetical protein